VERLPNSLLPADPLDFVNLIASIETIRYSVAMAERTSAIDLARGDDIKLLPRVAGGWNPVLVVHQVLARCPDESAAPASRDLAFIKDPDIRSEMLTDLTSVRSAVLNSEWKPATVIAGSIAEALLLWAIDQRAPDLPKACALVNSSGKRRRQLLVDNLEFWGLEEYIAVGSELNLMEPETSSQLKLVQAFRNLIHPGRARRKSQRCDRGTALSANAGVELLSRDLEARFA
jgi:hypothetical protein